MFKIFSHRQTAAPVVSEMADPITAREDFTIFDVDKLTVAQILSTLRLDTIDFATANDLTWAASDFVIRNVPVRVKLTENLDTIYIFDGETFFNSRAAAHYIENQPVQF